MKLIRGLHNLTRAQAASVVTIGNFDGLHLGHQRVLAQLDHIGEALNLPTTVIIFEPQPIEFFAPAKAPKRLARFREKLIHMQNHNVNTLLSLSFNQSLAEMEAETFVADILVNRLNTRHLVIGDDFKFGKNRQGNFKYLQQAGEKYGFKVDRTESLLDSNIRVSSTRIREAITADDFKTAKRLLGRPYALAGKVAHGQKLGRELGFPTINIKMGDKTLIVKGIFAVSVKGIDNCGLRGVASLGTRPTVNGIDTILEVYILDFNRDIYGYNVEVEFLHKIRDEKKFDSLKELTENIEQDIVRAKLYFDKNLP
jgi:riboflavin kinase / FMN adenylyltransferase